MSEVIRFPERVKSGSREAAKLLGAVAYAALFFAPHAANHAVETTSASVEIADFPADLSFYPDGSRLDILNQASIFADKQQAGIGVHAEVTGLPRFDSNEQLLDYFSPERFELYLSLADSPEKAVGAYQDTLVSDAKRRALEYELLWSGIGGAAIYGGLTSLRLRRKLHQLEGRETTDLPTAGYVAGLAAIAMAGSLTVADTNHQQWQDTQPKPENLATITALDGTTLEGTQIDNLWALGTVEKGVGYGMSLKERRSDQRDAYLATAIPALEAQISLLPELRENEELFFVMTDMHAGEAGLELAETSISALQTRYGRDKLLTVFNIGDTSYGTEVQRSAVLAQGMPELDVNVAVTRGNHDVDPVKDWLKKGDMIDLDGYETVNDIETYGRPDVQLTPFLSASYYPNTEETKTTQGEFVRTELDDGPVEVASLHQPATTGVFLGIDSMSDYLKSDEDEALTECDYGAGPVKSFPADLIQSGHWHKQFPLKMVCNEDGTWGVINIQGTGGGANEAPTWNNWSDPGGRPVKAVSFRAFIRNTEHKSITGSIDIEITPDAVVLPVTRTDIGTYDGAPFPTEETDEADAAADKPRPRHLKNTPN